MFRTLWYLDSDLIIHLAAFNSHRDLLIDLNHISFLIYGTYNNLKEEVIGFKVLDSSLLLRYLSKQGFVFFHQNESLEMQGSDGLMMDPVEISRQTEVY